MKRNPKPMTATEWRIARRRTARLVIRLADGDADRDHLLDVFGLTYEDACPVPNGAKTAPEPELVGAGSTGTEIVLDDITPVVAGRASSPAGGGESRPQEKNGPRRCTSCNKVKDASEFYRGRTKCKPCHQQTNSRAQRKRLAERPKGKPGRPLKPRVTFAQKQCSGCGLTKPSSDFHADARNADGLRSECADCSAERRRVRRREKAVA